MIKFCRLSPRQDSKRDNGSKYDYNDTNWLKLSALHWHFIQCKSQLL